MSRGKYDAFRPPVLPTGYTSPGNIRTFDETAREKQQEVKDGTVAKAKKRRLESADFGASDNDHFIGVDTSSAAITITLPSTSKVHDGQFFVIKDEGGAAGTNNVTITTSDNTLIDGNASVLLETNYAAINLYYNGASWFVY